MRFGINSFLFVSPFVTQSTRLFSKFKKWGFDTVELPIEAPEHIDSVKVKKALDRAGLACGSVCACMGPGRDFRGSAKDQSEAMKYCKALIDHMVNLGCPSLIGPVYSVVGKADAVDPKDQKKEFALVVKNLKVLAAYAEKKGVQICVEPLNRFETDFLNTCEKGLRLIKAVGSPEAQRWNKAIIGPTDAALIIVGKVRDVKQAERQVRQRFGSWSQRSGADEVRHQPVLAKRSDSVGFELTKNMRLDLDRR